VAVGVKGDQRTPFGSSLIVIKNLKFEFQILPSNEAGYSYRSPMIKLQNTFIYNLKPHNRFVTCGLFLFVCFDLHQIPNKMEWLRSLKHIVAFESKAFEARRC
jgi:hypothetical protein